MDMNDALEGAGFACLVAFAWCVWPPAALLVLGLGLVLVGNVRAARRKPNREPFSVRLARAVAAYRGVSRDRSP